MALIEKTGTGEWKLKGLDWRELNEIPEQARQAVYGALCKLKDYEESGLEPDCVEKLSVRDIMTKKKPGERVLVKEVSEAEYEVTRSGLRLIRSISAGFEILDDVK